MWVFGGGEEPCCHSPSSPLVDFPMGIRHQEFDNFGSVSLSITVSHWVGGRGLDERCPMVNLTKEVCFKLCEYVYECKAVNVSVAPRRGRQVPRDAQFSKRTLQKIRMPRAVFQVPLPPTLFPFTHFTHEPRLWTHDSGQSCDTGNRGQQGRRRSSCLMWLAHNVTCA